MFKDLNIALTIKKLGIEDFVLRGEPTNEVEFKEMFRKVIGTTDDGSAIESDDPNNFGVTWEEIKNKHADLEAEYNSLEWKRLRLNEYPSLDECIHALLDGGNTLTDLQGRRSEVKAKYPKPF
tara:strand:- start:178 stop:546 length:369 start_codon:yes stop_codon:yes gene_type:complete